MDESQRWTAGLPAVLALHPGEQRRHRLVSAAGAGSVWRPDLLDGDAGCAEVEIALEPDAAPSAPSGGPPPDAHGATETLLVRALRRGRARWRLRLGQPWQPDQPVAEHEFEIRVD